MLDEASRRRDMTQWIGSLPCHIQIPPRLRDDFEKTGPMPVPDDDLRRHRRVFCRGTKYQAALELQQSLPALPRKTEWRGVYTNDVSRTGCGFLHSEAIYPGERMRLVLASGIKRLIEAAWCRRLDKNCFLIGAQFVETDAAASVGE
jgi:hypothetical protein